MPQLNLALEASIAITLTLFSGFLIWGGRRRTHALSFLAALTGSLGLMIVINLMTARLPGGVWNDFNLFLELLVGPLLYLYVVQVQPGAQGPSWALSRHLAPAVLGLTIWEAGLVDSMDLFVLAVMVIYLGMAWSHFWSHRQRIRSTPLLQFLRIFLGLFTVLMCIRGIVGLGASAEQSFFQLPLYTALLGILLAVVWLVVLTALRYPDLLSAPETYIPYAQAGADEQTLHAQERRLVQLMESERPYLQPELGIEDVAEQLELSPRHLSQLTNSRFGLTFPAYINSWRVREAARLLCTERGKPVKTVMYDCGFRSKSVFNREFQRHMGVTPTQYRGSCGGDPAD